MTTSRANNTSVLHPIVETSVKHCYSCGCSLGHPTIEERLTQAQRNTRCITRAVRLMFFLTAFAAVGLGHSTVFLPFWPQTMEQYLMQWPVKMHCVLGLAAFMCAIVFSRLRLNYSRELDWCVEQYQRLTTQSELNVIPLSKENTGSEEAVKQAA